MRRPGYRDAIRWIAHNDDTEWIHDDEPIHSVTSVMVQDLFEVEPERLVADLRRELKKGAQ